MGSRQKHQVKEASSANWTNRLISSIPLLSRSAPSLHQWKTRTPVPSSHSVEELAAWMHLCNIPALGNQALWISTVPSEICYSNVTKTSCNVLTVQYQIQNSVISAPTPKRVAMREKRWSKFFIAILLKMLTFHHELSSWTENRYNEWAEQFFMSSSVTLFNWGVVLCMLGVFNSTLFIMLFYCILQKKKISLQQIENKNKTGLWK